MPGQCRPADDHIARPVDPANGCIDAPGPAQRCPSLGVTTAVMGNCGFGIVPSPPPLRDLIMRNLAVVEGMDIDALRAGIDWRFQSFAEYMAMLRGRGPYMNLGVLVGHSAVRTAVMGEDASVRKQPSAAELAEMKRLVSEAMDQGASGLGASYSLNHSGWGGVPMPSTISGLGWRRSPRTTDDASS
jgi:N-acyl-D-amino-acid deacylase